LIANFPYIFYMRLGIRCCGCFLRFSLFYAYPHELHRLSCEKHYDQSLKKLKVIHMHLLGFELIFYHHFSLVSL
jgi:hypothetical protein